MKNILHILFSATIFLFSFSSFAQDYQTVQSGQWTNSSTWENGNVPPKKQNNITIRINEGHAVVFQADAKKHEMGNGVTVEVNGSFTKNGWNTFKVGTNAHFIVNGTMTFNTHSKFKAKNDATFDIYGTFIHNSNSAYGNNTTFNVYENATMENLQLIKTKNNTSFNIHGEFINENYFVDLGDNTTINVFNTGSFDNLSRLETGDNFEMTVSGSFINEGWKLKAGQNSSVFITDSGSMETNTNMIFGDNMLMIVDGETVVSGWNFSFGQGTEIQVLGTLNVENNHVFQSKSSDNVFYACEGSVNNPEYIKKVMNYQDCQVLPVELLYFEAQIDINNDVLLTWATASETNSNYFTLERSTDGQSWKALQTIQSAGNSNHLIEYAYTDTDTKSGVYYYRLVQTDFDGAFEIFQPVAIEKQKLNTFGIYNVYKSQNQVTIQGGFQSQDRVIVTDLMGNVLYNGSFTTDQRQISFHVDNNVSAIVVNYMDGVKIESTYSRKFAL